MQRREFIGLIGGATVYPLTALAQQSARLPIVGFIIPGTLDSHGKWVAAFTARLVELGWIDGRTVTLAYRWAEGRPERFPDFAKELAGLKADVFVTTVPEGIVAIQEAAPDTPIVATALSTGSPFVKSLSHPGGMVTGPSQLGPELGGKRLELLTEVVPQLRHVAVMGVESDAKRIPETAAVTAAAQQRGIEITPLIVSKADDLAPAIASVRGAVEALYVVIHPLMSVNRARIASLALDAGLPTMHGLPDNVRAGGLMSYGASFETLFRLSADYVDKILRGARPGDLPVEQPTKFDLVINLKTAKALGLIIPPPLLSTADEVIE